MLVTELTKGPNKIILFQNDIIFVTSASVKNSTKVRYILLSPSQIVETTQQNLCIK